MIVRRVFTIGGLIAVFAVASVGPALADDLAEYLADAGEAVYSGRRVVGTTWDGFESVGIATKTVDTIGGSPRSTTEIEDATLHQSSFRVGAEYHLADLLLLRLGIDRIGDGSAGEMIPSAGFTLRYAVGELGTRFDYTFGKEAYGLGTFHLIGIRFYI